MCRNKSSQKKALALALATEGMVWACYESTDYGDGRDLTTVVIQKKDTAASFAVTHGGELKLEKVIRRFTFEGYNALKRTFALPIRETFVAPCYC